MSFLKNYNKLSNAEKSYLEWLHDVVLDMVGPQLVDDAMSNLKFRLLRRKRTTSKSIKATEPIEHMKGVESIWEKFPWMNKSGRKAQKIKTKVSINTPLSIPGEKPGWVKLGFNDPISVDAFMRFGKIWHRAPEIFALSSLSDLYKYFTTVGFAPIDIETIETEIEIYCLKKFMK